MISQIKQQGFTIVELLIVIVVIAILAALSYVGYTSITARANNSTAAATAKTIKDTAQTFNGSHSAWPANRAEFISGYPSGGAASDAIAKMPSDITFISGVAYASASTTAQAWTGTGAPKTALVYSCGSPVSGFRIYTKNFTGTPANSTDVGDCSTDPTGNSLAQS